jgi:hypothetical protein
MDNTKLAEEFLRQVEAGEFDGRLYKIIMNLSKEELSQIAMKARGPYERGPAKLRTSGLGGDG